MEVHESSGPPVRLDKTLEAAGRRNELCANSSWNGRVVSCWNFQPVGREEIRQPASKFDKAEQGKGNPLLLRLMRSPGGFGGLPKELASERSAMKA